jgi:xylan 1,4-beta-xylosidase
MKATLVRAGSIVFWVLTAALASPAIAADAGRPVTVTVDASRSEGPLPPVWRFFGADEPNYATMKDGRKLLVELGNLRRGEVYFRAHNLLNTGDGTPAFKWGSTNAYTETPDGKPVYDWTVVDRIIDTYLARGIHPYLQIGFMPEVLSTAPAGVPYQHLWRPGFDYKLIATGWSYPPASYEKWGELVYQWTLHNIGRYGRDEVAKWYFEVWNEPNSNFYWQGTPQDFYKLHDVAIAAVRRALPVARVGGPDVAGAGGAFMDGFLEHVSSGKNYVTGEIGTPTDFLAFHAKGRPAFVDGHVRMGISTHLKEVDNGFQKIAAVTALAAKPIVIGELYRSKLRAHLGARAEAPRESRRRVDLGFRIRESALVCRLSPAIYQRRQFAGAQRVPHVRETWFGTHRRQERRADTARSDRGRRRARGNRRGRFGDSHSAGRRCGAGVELSRR